MEHEKQIIVNCWKCGKPFDVVTAERCYWHLNGKITSWYQFHDIKDSPSSKWTTKCSHCGACICHKYKKMESIDCGVLNKVGISKVMPSVKRQLQFSEAVYP